MLGYVVNRSFRASLRHNYQKIPSNRMPHLCDPE